MLETREMEGNVGLLASRCFLTIIRRRSRRIMEQTEAVEKSMFRITIKRIH